MYHATWFMLHDTAIQAALHEHIGQQQCTARPPLADSPLVSSVQHLTCVMKHNSCRMLPDTWLSYFQCARSRAGTPLDNHTAQQDFHWEVLGWRPVTGMLHVSCNIDHVACLIQATLHEHIGQPQCTARSHWQILRWRPVCSI